MLIYDVCIIGAGASGLFCALHAALRGKTVAVLDHKAQTGRKLRVTGGGRCNYGNMSVGPEHFLSENLHFTASALARFEPLAFKHFLEENGLETEEEPGGKLFCRQGADAVANLLERKCREAGVEFILDVRVKNIERNTDFRVTTSRGSLRSAALVVACGGLAWPQTGASCFGYGVAETFGLTLVEPRPALTPLIMPTDWPLAELSGLSLPATISLGKQRFTDALLFTHRGLSGPVVLQISSHWSPGQTLSIDLLPGQDLKAVLDKARTGKSLTKNVIAKLIPARLTAAILPPETAAKPVSQLRKEELAQVLSCLTAWKVTPKEVGGYKKAEVTAGGVDTRAVSSKTMESLAVPNLYFIGEVLDVTGHLGGYNLHWAWASAFACAQSL